MTERYKIDLFYAEQVTQKYLNINEITDDIESAQAIHISNLPMDFPPGTTSIDKKKFETWLISVLPTLNSVKSLSIRSVRSEHLFEAISALKGLEILRIESSPIQNLPGIAKLQNLKSLSLDSFSRLNDISSIRALKHLELLSIENSFNISNYELIGNMPQLKGLRLGGDAFKPKRLQLNSLKPFGTLLNLRHLDLSSAAIKDNSYDTILELQNLERFDISISVPKPVRDLIKVNHKHLKAGFFMDWDFENKKFYEGKLW